LDYFVLIFNGSDWLAVSGRDRNATWLSTSAFCSKRGWSLHRLIQELQGGLRYRTIPEGYVVDWHGPNVVRSLNVERSEVMLPPGTEEVPEGVVGLGTLLVGLELLEPHRPRRRTPRVSLPPPSTDAPAAAPGPLTVVSKEEAASILPTGEWLVVTARCLRDEGKYLKDTQKNELAKVLAAESKKAVKVGQLGHTLEVGYLKKLLKPLGIWPLSSLK
jgi:hypothetical protein